MDEFALIERYFAEAQLNSDVLLGIGDDCAIVQPPTGRHLVMSIDTMVAGVHFPLAATGEQVGSRAMGGALSDLAAMGARPHWFTLALTIPKASAGWLSGFSRGVFDMAQRFDCSLIGGDTTRGPLCVTVQVHGSIMPGAALCRAGARAGDTLYVTGALGDGAAALAVINGEFAVDTQAAQYLNERFYAPSPRILEGQLLAEAASAAIDISDGLCADLGKICEASAIGALVDVSRLPISALWRQNMNEDRSLSWALAGGDDYELCFTVPPAQVARVEHWIKEGKLCASAIGEMTPEPGLRLTQNGRPYVPHSRGYNHFG